MIKPGQVDTLYYEKYAGSVEFYALKYEATQVIAHYLWSGGPGSYELLMIQCEAFPKHNFTWAWPEMGFKSYTVPCFLLYPIIKELGLKVTKYDIPFSPYRVIIPEGHDINEHRDLSLQETDKQLMLMGYNRELVNGR